MGYKDITAGDKIARAKAARFIKSKGGTLGLEVAFEFEEPATGTPERLNWVGWLSPAAIENTMETMYNVLGFNGSEQTDPNGVLTDPNAFDYKREVKLVVELRPRQDANGVQKFDEEGNPILDPTIKWVNRIGGSAFQGVSVDTVKADLQNVGFRAAFLAAKNKSGGGQKKQAQQPSFNTEEEIPF